MSNKDPYTIIAKKRTEEEIESSDRRIKAAGVDKKQALKDAIPEVVIPRKKSRGGMIPLQIMLTPKEYKELREASFKTGVKMAAIVRNSLRETGVLAQSER